MPRLFFALILTILAAPAIASPCRAPDNLTRVTGGSECLVIKTVETPGGSTLRLGRGEQ
ncbi:MAG: hypothetical protein HYU60_06690 [Magnetospirillum sp.]|nr:hypothetical protein [Magnetospirillum sp.]